MPAPRTSSRKKGKPKGKGKGKGREQEQEQEQEQEMEQEMEMEIDLEHDDNSGNNTDDRPTIVLPPPPSVLPPSPMSTNVARSSTSPMPSSTSTSVSVASSSKRKFSALDLDDSVSVASGSRSSAKRSSPGVVAMEGIRDNLGAISNSMRDYNSIRQQQLDARPNKDASIFSADLDRAVRLLQEIEPDPANLVNLVEIITNNSSAVRAFLSIDREDYRKAWVEKRLSDLRRRQQ